MSDVVHVDDSNFEAEVLKSDKPVLVDFSATWCGPCKAQLPVVEKFATENKGNFKVCKVDIDEAPVLASKLGIRSVPSLFFFKEGLKIDSKVGLTSMAGLDTLVGKKTGA